MKKYASILIFVIITIASGCNKQDSPPTVTSGTDSIAPTPGNSSIVSVSNVGATTLTLTWTRAADNESAQEQLSYAIYYSLSNNIETLANAETNGLILQYYTTDIDTQSLTGLLENRHQYFTVVVKDENGNKAAYNCVSQNTSPLFSAAGFVDGNNADGINIDTAKDGEFPILVSNNSKLYAIWQEAGATVPLIRVKEWNGTDAWTAVDGGGLKRSASPGGPALLPHAVSFNNKLYIAWQEMNLSNKFQIRVAEYDGTNWTYVDGNEAETGINKLSGYDAYNVKLKVHNTGLYASWEELKVAGPYQVRIAQWDGTGNWTFVDGAGEDGINKNPATQGILSDMETFNSELYVTWIESDGSKDQIRVKSWDGTAWLFADGGGTTGINHNTGMNASAPSLFTFKEKLYAAWEEEDNGGVWQIRVKVYDGSGIWSPVDNDLAFIGINYNSLNNAVSPDFAVMNDKLFLVWKEELETNLYQIRIAAWDENQYWYFADGNLPWGLNKEYAYSAVAPHITTHNSKIFIIWSEENASNISQVRVMRSAN